HTGGLNRQRAAEQADAADALRGKAASRSFGSQKTLASARLIGKIVSQTESVPECRTRFSATSSIFGGFAQDVRVNQICHRESVVSGSIGTKNPFSGHAASQSTTPWFGGGVRRTNR